MRWTSLAVWACVLWPLPASAVRSGIVFVDANANGIRDAGEPGRADVRVTNGLDVVRSGPSGRYELPDREGFVYLTRPAGFRCDVWYAEAGADFALLPETPSDEFFFIQISDAHVYDRKSDFAEFSSAPIPWWFPQSIADWLTLRFMAETYGDEVPQRLREALAPGIDASDLGDVAAFRAYSDEFAREGSTLGDVTGAARAAMAEVAALKPEFLISTGDLVLEGNNGSAEAVDRWFAFYQELASNAVARYDTIGNNEIAGSSNDTFPPSDPRYGKFFFRKYLGPTYFSFDRGPFHFVALDTHRLAPTEDEPEHWDFNRMEPDVAKWLDADLAANRERVLVVLNHEPFHFDETWPFEQDVGQTSDDEGLFAKHGVRWVLSGHTHFNSFKPGDEITHITTGALSGFRWVLPASVHERGYRLFYARDRELFSAWKRTGEPLLSVSEGARLPGRVVIVLADADRPFAGIRVEYEGSALPVERWGAYFASFPVSSEHGKIAVTGLRAEGAPARVTLEY